MGHKHLRDYSMIKRDPDEKIEPIDPVRIVESIDIDRSVFKKNKLEKLRLKQAKAGLPLDKRKNKAGKGCIERRRARKRAEYELKKKTASQDASGDTISGGAI